MQALWAQADGLSMHLYTTLWAKSLCLLSGPQPTDSSSWKGREPLLYSPELRHKAFPPLPSVGGSGVPGDRGTEEPKYFTQTWLVMALLFLGDNLGRRYLPEK